MLMFSLIPRSRPSSLNAWDVNCGPLSEMLLSGSPYLQ